MRASQVPTGITATAHAKLNLSLRVIGRRPDGLHEISSTMCSVDYGDSVKLCLRGDGLNSLEVSGADTGPDLQNLALKAAKVFQDFAGRDGVGFDLYLDKKVPPGSGLGGGSADAAAVLHLANEATGAGYSAQDLVKLGREIGSDVPFCVVGGLARVTSAGESVTACEFPSSLGSAWFVIAVPDFWLSTGDVYAAFDSLRTRGEEEAPPAALEGAVEVFVNDLEPAAEWLAPPLRKMRRKLSSILGSPARMTGSGSALFGVCASHDEAVGAAREARKLFRKVIVCRAAHRGVSIDFQGPTPPPSVARSRSS